MDLEVMGVSWGRRGDVGSALWEEGRVYDLLLPSELSCIVFLLRMTEGLLETVVVWAAASKIFP